MSKRKLFGTDGIRGKANNTLTADVALRAGIAAGSLFKKQREHNKVIIGKDTRLSGYMLESALVAGFSSVGMDVFLVGPIPTPGIAMLTKSMRADLGVMISASHNLYQDNGIKIFGPDGNKLSDEIEERIEDLMYNGIESHLVKSEDIGRAKRIDDALGRYIEHVKRTFPERTDLKGLKVVVDCANGAAYKVAPTVLEELEAKVISLNVSPDGTNINDKCGAVSPEYMCEQTVKHGADIGISLDGDADRVIICDEKGQIMDGDKILAMIAGRMRALNSLKGGSVVATVMSNMGLEDYLKGIGVGLIRTAVGDRYVTEEMFKKGYNLGGEQSGHIILSDYGTTGDGTVAALQILGELTRRGKPLSKIADLFTPYPQVLRNVNFDNMSKASKILTSEKVKAAIQKGEENLRTKGRILVRKSGTEPKIRVMLESRDEKIIKEISDDIISTIEAESK